MATRPIFGRRRGTTPYIWQAARYHSLYLAGGAAPLPIFGRRRGTTPSIWQVARYHSLYSIQAKQPACLRTTAVTADGTVMAIQHTSLPIAAVQFHPESILTAPHIGMQMLLNATKMKWK